MLWTGSHIEDTQQAAVHNVLEVEAHSVLEPLDQEGMAQEDMGPDARDLAAALEEEDLAAVEAAGRQISHLLEAREVREATLDCSIALDHVPQTVDIVDAEREALQFRP